jgi:hypothetical protein
VPTVNRGRRIVRPLALVVVRAGSADMTVPPSASPAVRSSARTNVAKSSRALTPRNQAAAVDPLLTTSTVRCSVRTSCTDNTGHRTDCTCRAGIARHAGSTARSTRAAGSVHASACGSNQA